MDEEMKKEYIEVCIKDIKTDVYRILGNRGLLRPETRSVEEAIKLTIPKIITLFVERLEDQKEGAISHKAMTLNNEELWMFKKEDICKLKELFRG